MAITNKERIGKALDLLRQGLAPFVDREVQAAVGAGSMRMETIRRFSEDPLLAARPVADWDAAGLLKLMWETWNEVFRKTLGFAERTLDSMARLLTAISAPEAEELGKMKMELRRLVFDEQVRGEKRKAGGSL